MSPIWLKVRRVALRLLQAVPTVFGILVVCFLLILFAAAYIANT